jgi:hypothetical protein
MASRARIGQCFKRAPQSIDDHVGRFKEPFAMTAILRTAFIPFIAVAALISPSITSAQSCVESCTGNIGVGGDVSGYENCMSRCTNSGARPATTTTLAPVDPCYIAQNAMRPCTPAPKGLDARLVGTWILPLKDGSWTWKISRNGTYKFHSEAKDQAPDHAGTISANHGVWALKATSGITGYTDQGTYKLQPPDTLLATGKLGPGIWRRASDAAQPAKPDSPARAAAQ